MTDRDILPDNVRPSHYSLTLRDIDFKEWKYKGTVTIDLEIKKPTKEIIINAVQLKFKSATLTTPAGKLDSAAFSYDEHVQRATIALPEEVAPAHEATLTIEFEGVISNDLCGFYRSKYKPGASAAESVPRDGDFHYMLSTQFESCDARRAFPCWDEPNIKATFDFALEIPDDLVALGNMNVKGERATRDGFKLVSFERTPVMSTYLLAWAIGDLEYIEAFTEREYNGRKIPVRVYTTRGLQEQGRWALEHAGPIIDYFSEVFGIDYPLPKADLIAVHEYAMGAMENWGLITYRPTALLFDEKTSDASLRNHVAYVVAHELAHQWFGNLVTMDWWDELWLNEGFATWVGWLAVDHLHPDWDVWSQFVNGGMECAFSLDGMRSSHPIHVPVRDALEVDQIFDNISYLKGCSVIRMLADHLGAQTFLDGVARYLAKHAYGNAKTAALWEALADASGKPVAELMGDWVGKIGYPVLTVAEEPGQISVRQTRFLSTGDPAPEEDETIWWVPLALRGKKGTAEVAKIALHRREDTVRDVDDEFYQLNADAPGFYRVNYPPPRLLKLGTQLDRLSVADKIATIGSAADLAYAGYGTTAALLAFLQGFRGETHRFVWSAALNAVGRVKGIFGGDEETRKGLEKFTRVLIEAPLRSLGLEYPEGEDMLVTMLRQRMVATADASGNEEVTAELVRRFDAWVADPEANPINPNMRSSVYRAAVVADPARAIPVLKHEWFTTKSVDGKTIILSVLGTTRDPDLIKSQILPFLYEASPPAPPNESVPVMNMNSLSSSLNGNRIARSLNWEYVKENWDAIAKKINNNLILNGFVNKSLDGFVRYEDADDMERFFAGVDTRIFDKKLAQILDKVRARAKYRERDAEGVKQWLVQNGYA